MSSDGLDPAMHPHDHEPAAAAASRYPVAVLLAGLGGLALLVGAFLPWVTVGQLFAVNGVTARYGIAAIIGGALALMLAVQVATGRLLPPRAADGVAVAAILFGVVSAGLAGYAGFAVRDAIAEQQSDQEEALDTSAELEDSPFAGAFEGLEETLAEAFKVGTGSGVYVTLIGGLITTAAGVAALRRPT